MRLRKDVSSLTTSCCWRRSSVLKTFTRKCDKLPWKSGTRHGPNPGDNKSTWSPDLEIPYLDLRRHPSWDQLRKVLKHHHEEIALKVAKRSANKLISMNWSTIRSKLANGRNEPKPSITSIEARSPSYDKDSKMCEKRCICSKGLSLKR